MPLIEGKSQKSFEKNLKTEMHHDKPLKQSLAIAYALKRKAQHKDAHMCEGGSCEHPSHKMADGGDIPPVDPSTADSFEQGFMGKAYKPQPKPSETPVASGYAKGGEMKSKRERAMEAFHKMAEGGMMTDMGYQSKEKPEVDGDLMPEAHLKQELAEHVAHMDAPDSSVKHDVMNQMGDEDEGAGDMDAIHPMVRRIMMGMAKGYSKGGMVANEESGESTDKPTMAKADGNEFDDLALRDDLEFDSTGANSGDELGDEQEDDDRHDIVSRIMKSRAKKDKMAVPGEGSTYGKRK
jgi:hypothetical protein